MGPELVCRYLDIVFTVYSIHTRSPAGVDTDTQTQQQRSHEV